jgi:hypothetical protein
MHKQILVALVALGVLLTATGQVGAVASPTAQTIDGDATTSITDVSSSITVDAGYLNAGVFGDECLSDGSTVDGDCNT